MAFSYTITTVNEVSIMKKLFIYYSYTGNGNVVATFLKENGVEIRQVIRKKKLPKSFFWGVMAGGFLAGTKHKDKLEGFDENIEEYEKSSLVHQFGTLESLLQSIQCCLNLT